MTSESINAFSSKLKRNMSGRLKINDGCLNDTYTQQKISNTTNAYNSTNSNYATLQCHSNKLIRNSSFAKLEKSNSQINLNFFCPSRTIYSKSSNKINTSLRHLSKEIKGNVNANNTDFYDKQILLLKKEKKNYLRKTSLLLQKEMVPKNYFFGYDNYLKYNNGKENQLFQIANNNSFLRINTHSQISDFKNKLINKTKKSYLNY